ncbi:MAG: DUF262 domain-containing protein [Hyperionvirus sp.]|uniref:DUF262 domain-containing protein n=1 Tax=Hyperionvirus sp. TaxID=2487770 RepID=A0A3G5A816_9VIRU|nr:MAG: DUF262 domain-containing protein [Hyperionvirus sp.]
MTTDFGIWQIEDIIDAIREKPEKKRRINIAKFQRRRAWGEDHEYKLIDSIERGYPISSITLYKYRTNPDGCDQYLIIDGLQRIITIIKYINNPLKFRNNIDRINQYRLAFSDKFQTVDHAILDNLIAFWFCEDFFNSYNDIIQKNYMNYVDKLKDYLKKIKLTKTNRELMEQFIKDKSAELSRFVKISDFKIPVILSNSDKIYDIFERLNTSGIILNQFEICAASWFKYNFINIVNTDVKKEIVSYYDTLKGDSENLDIDLPNDPQKQNEYTYFEYVQGLKGYVLNNTNAFSGFIMSTPEFIFHLIGLCFNGEFSLEKIPLKLQEQYQKDKFMSFEKSLLGAIKTVEILVSDFNPKLLNINQIYILVATYFQTKQKPNHDLMSLHILCDKIISRWKTSINEEEIKKAMDNNMYNKKISNSDIVRMFNKYSVMSTNKRVKVVPNATDNLFLRMIYVKILGVSNIKINMSHVEHIVTKKLVKGLCEREGITLPLGHVGNLCVLSDRVRTNKSKQTIIDYLQLLRKTKKIERIEIEKNTFLDSIDYSDKLETDEYTKDHFDKFVAKRFDKMKSFFTETYGHIIEATDLSDDYITDDSDSDDGTAFDQYDVGVTPVVQNPVPEASAKPKITKIVTRR